MSGKIEANFIQVPINPFLKVCRAIELVKNSRYRFCTKIISNSECFLSYTVKLMIKQHFNRKGTLECFIKS